MSEIKNWYRISRIWRIKAETVNEAVELTKKKNFDEMEIFLLGPMKRKRKLKRKKRRVVNERRVRIKGS